MSLPGGAFSAAPMPSALLNPDTAARVLTQDFERGGVALNDPSQGLGVRDWKCWTDGSAVYVAPYPELAPQTLVLVDTDVTEVSLAFDQNMAATVAYVAAGVSKLRWYNSLLSAFTVTEFAGATGPMLTLDDKRPSQTGTSDILLFYIRAGLACYRQQRDRFGIEFVLGAVTSAVTRVVACGMGVNGRLQVYLKSAPPMHADISTDTLYLGGFDNTVRPMFAGQPMTAQWLSGVFSTDEQPTFGWAKVEALAYPARLTLYGDSGAVATVTITDDEPFRLPPVRSREWQVEVVSAGRVVAVRLAESRQELEADDANLSL